MASTATTSLTPLKILMLHGYTQSGSLFDLKSRALQKSLRRAFPRHQLSFSFPTAPHRLLPAEHPSASSSSFKSRSQSSEHDHMTPMDKKNEELDYYGWWRRTSDDPIIYDGMREGFEALMTVIRNDGPFDGVLGFSQGGAMAAMLASALEGREWPESQLGFPSPFKELESISSQHSLKFAMIYSGFKVLDTRCEAFFSPMITTPTCHFIGSLDTVVEEGRSRALIEACKSPQVIIHPGGHFLPSQKAWLDAAIVFLSSLLKSTSSRHRAVQEGSVEDIELPF